MAEERIVLTAELKDELSAPLSQIEKKVDRSTKKMAADSNREGRRVTKGLQRIAKTVSKTFTTTSKGLKKIATGVGAGWRFMFRGLAGDSAQTGTAVTTRWGKVGTLLGKYAGVVREGFSRAFTALGTLAQRAVTRIQTSFSGLTDAVSRSGQAMIDGFSATMARLQASASGAVEGVSGALAGIAGVATLGAGTVISRALTTGLERAKVVQDTVASGKILLGDEEKALELVGKLREVVTGTPFNLPDFAKAGMDLVAFGTEADKVPGIMRAIGEASAGRGEAAVETARSLALNIAQMTAVGTTSMDDIWSFASAGVPALKILGNYLGQSTEDMQKLISEGLLPADKAIEYLTDGIMNGTNGINGETKALSGSMEELRKTVSGSWGALLAGVAKMGTKFWDPLETGNSGMMAQLPKLFNALNGLGGALGEKVFGPLGIWLAKMELIPKVTKWIEDLTKGLKDGAPGGLLDKLKEMAPTLAIVAAIMAGFIGKSLQKLPWIGKMFRFINFPIAIFIALLSSSPKLREAVGKLLGTLAAGFKLVLEKLEPLIPIISDAVVWIGDRLADAINWLIEFLPKAADKIWEWREPIIVVAGLITALLIPGWAALAIQALIKAGQVVVAWVTTQVAAVKAAFVHSFAVVGMVAKWAWLSAQAMWHAAKIAAAWLISLGPIGWIILAIAGLVALFIWAYNNVEWFRTGVDTALRWIGETAKIVCDWIIGAWNNVVNFWNTYVMPVLIWLRDAFNNTMTWIKNLVWNAITIIVAIWKTLVDYWNVIVMPALKWLGDMFGLIMKTIYEIFIKPVIDNIVGAFNGLISFWNTHLKPIITVVAAWFGENIKKGIEQVKPVIEFLQKAFGLFIAYWSEKLKPVTDAIAEAFRFIGEKIGEALSGLDDFAKNPLGGIQDWLGIEKDENGQGIMGTGGGIPGASGGAVVGRAAGGTVLPGYAPGRDTIPYALSPGESVLVPELTRQIGPENIMKANHAASHGRPAGDGPMRKAGGGGPAITVADGAIRLTFQGNADYAEVKRAARDALNEVLERQKRSY